MDFVTGARMHACIAALSAGVAVVPLAYSRKFNGLLETLGYPHLADGKADSLEQAEAKIMTGFQQRVTLAADARRSASKALARLADYETDLATLFGGLRPPCA